MNDGTHSKFVEKAFNFLNTNYDMHKGTGGMVITLWNKVTSKHTGCTLST
ncbi:unnamed protein product, partial [Urochloa humidicola]